MGGVGGWAAGSKVNKANPAWIWNEIGLSLHLVKLLTRLGGWMGVLNGNKGNSA